MWEVLLETHQSKMVVNNILDQTTKQYLAKYFHVTLFSPTTRILIKSFKMGFLKKWPGLIEGLIKKHI